MAEWWSYIIHLDLETILAWLERYKQWGPLPGIALPMLEGFVPLLPLFAIIIANAAAFGLWQGFLWSWIGVTLGNICIFLLSRRFGGRLRHFIERRFPRSSTFFIWIEHKGFLPLFLFSCLPFSPHTLITIVSGMSRIRFTTYLLATASGRILMVLAVSFVGYDLRSLFDDPWKIIFFGSLCGLLWVTSRRLEARYRNLS